MTDRLAEIKRRVNQGGGYLSGTCMNDETLRALPDDIDWLIQEVERLRAELQVWHNMALDAAELMERNGHAKQANDLKTALTQHKPECG